MNITTRKQAMSAGNVRYFTGKPCRRGHIAQRWTKSAKCTACHYEENPLKPITTKEERAEMQAARGRRYYLKNKQAVIERSRKWKSENHDKVKNSKAKWRKKETSKAITFMRDSLQRVIRSKKKSSTEDILGYTRYDLIRHIERQFVKGMSWDNHGEWHIDHIIPVSVHIENGETNPSVVNCLTNLMPVWAHENLRKNNQVETLL